jgi:DNA-binding NtrC family response regulator
MGYKGIPMQRICFLNTDADVVRQVRSLIPFNDIKTEIDCMLVTSPANIQEYAYRAIQEGASTIVAAGWEAIALRASAGCPVVAAELMLPELAAAVLQAKQLVQKTSPRIAFIGLPSHNGWQTFFQNVLSASLLEYPVENIPTYEQYIDHVRRQIEKAREKQADCLIGNKLVCTLASHCGIPAVSADASLDSLHEAFRIAEKISLSVEEEAKKEAGLYKKRYSGAFVAAGKFEQVIAHSSVMATAVRQAGIYAHYDTPILITGEIGSGKKMLAQCIHNAGSRRENPFAAVDCSTMPSESLDHLLYGMNGKVNELAGLLRIANNGTLYLGNVCALDMYGQQKLAGVLSDNTYFDPTTGNLVTLTSRVRLICASRQDISTLVAQGKFSPALYCALQTLTLHVPPLRERREDIWGLAQRYISEFSLKHKKHVFLEEDVLEILHGFSWPGNDYQLQKYCERLVVLTGGGGIGGSLAEQLLPIWGESYDYDAAMDTGNEYDRILNALKLHGGNRNDVAEELGLSKTTLWRRMKQYGIQWQ